jgi:hypothetical protein
MMIGKEFVMKKDKWIWMPHAGHFICADRCKFRLNTYVGEYIVSTVGEMYLTLDGEEKLETVGCDRLYETMVFKAVKSNNQCCPYRIVVEKEVDFKGYNKPEDARRGHLELCQKWSLL